MSKKEKTYTYRYGQKIELEKSPDQIVVRILPDDLDDEADHKIRAGFVSIDPGDYQSRPAGNGNGA